MRPNAAPLILFGLGVALSACGDEPEPAARIPDAAGVIEFDEPGPPISGDTMGPTTIVVAGRTVEVPAGTPRRGECEALYTSGDLPCVGQVGLDVDGNALWVTLFNTRASRTGGPEHLPSYDGRGFSTAGELRELADGYIVLADGTWIPGSGLQGACMEGDPVEVTVDDTATALGVTCLGTD